MFSLPVRQFYQLHFNAPTISERNPRKKSSNVDNPGVYMNLGNLVTINSNQVTILHATDEKSDSCYGPCAFRATHFDHTVTEDTAS